MKNIKILVPSDLSEFSNVAFKTANELAVLFGGSVTPLHIMDLPPKDHGYSFPLSLNYDVDYEEIGKELNQQLNEFAVNSVDAKFLKPGIVRKGPPASTINSTAADFDIVVMASHGRSGFKRYLIGSVTEEVIRLSEIPVLIVKKHTTLGPLKKILLPTDFSENSLSAFPTVIDIAKQTGAQVDLVYVATFNMFPMFGLNTDAYKDEIVKRTRKRFKKLIEEHFSEIEDQITHKIITTPKSAHESLTDLTEDSAYDLMVMSTMGHSGLEYLVLGSTAANVVRHISVPLLVTRPPKKEKSYNY